MGVSESVAKGLAEALGGDLESLTVEDMLHVRLQDFDEAVSSMMVEGVPATALQ